MAQTQLNGTEHKRIKESEYTHASGWCALRARQIKGCMRAMAYLLLLPGDVPDPPAQVLQAVVPLLAVAHRNHLQRAAKLIKKTQEQQR
jgi:hypothetical protein